MKRPSGVVVSGVLLILASLFQLLMAFCMALAGAFMHRQAGAGAFPAPASAGPIPEWMPFFMGALGLVFLALAAWGIATAVGLFRMRRWARYSVLAIGGGLALIGLISCFSTLVLTLVPLPVPANVDPAQTHAVQSTTRVALAFVALFYGLVCAVGVYWLVYFNLKSVREAFAGAGELPGASEKVAASRRPFMISAIAVLDMIGACVCLPMALLPFPGAIFGWILHGWQKAAIYLAFCALQGAAGVGLWRLEEWGRRLALGVLALGAVNCIVYLVHPSLIARYSAEIAGTIAPMQPQLPEPAQTVINSVSMGFSVLVILAIAAVLIRYRAAFARPIEPKLVSDSSV